MNLLKMIIMLMVAPALLPAFVLATSAPAPIARRGFATPPAVKLRGLSALIPPKIERGVAFDHNCTICEEELGGDESSWLKFGCGHVFHKQCIFSWLIAHWQFLGGNPCCAACLTAIPLNDINAAGFNQTPPQIQFYNLICDGTVDELIRFLIENEVDLNFRYQEGLTALHLAVIAGRNMIVEFLLEQQSIDPSLLDADEKTAFDYIKDEEKRVVAASRFPRFAGYFSAVAVAGGLAAYCWSRR